MPKTSNDGYLTNDEVRTIRAIHAKGFSIIAIARYFHLPQNVVRDLIRGVTYADVK